MDLMTDIIDFSEPATSRESRVLFSPKTPSSNSSFLSSLESKKVPDNTIIIPSSSIVTTSQSSPDFNQNKTSSSLNNSSSRQLHHTMQATKLSKQDRIIHNRMDLSSPTDTGSGLYEDMQTSGEDAYG